jgi:hypothetical protein
MAKRKFEIPQTGNPHRLTIKQHVFPCASIARFVDTDGGVTLHHLLINKVRKATPRDHVFYAMRAWDMHAERGYMKKIEDEFQNIASQIVEGTLTKIDSVVKHKIDRFFALWKMRAIFRDKEMSDVSFNGLTGENFTQDQEEIYEKMGILYIRQGGVTPAHRMHGIQIQAGIMHETSALSNVQWGIVQAHEGQFIVPDFPSTTCIPLAPMLCLCGTMGNLIEKGIILKNNVININRHLKENSKEYYFANDLEKCF